MDRRPGCLTGLLELFFLNTIFDWGQKNFGFGKGGCCGCGCGIIMLIVFVALVMSVLFGTSWTEFRLFVPGFVV